MNNWKKTILNTTNVTCLLTLVTKEQVNDKFIEQIDFKITLISEKAIFYLFVNNISQINYDNLYPVIKNFINNTPKNIEFDIKSFVHEQWSEIEVIHFFAEISANAKHKLWTLKAPSPPNIIADWIFNSKHPDLLKILEFHELRAKIMIEVRNLEIMPPNILTPPAFADYISQTMSSVPNIKTIILNKAQIQAASMNLLLAVNQGSQYEPRVVTLEYLNNPASELTIGLVGKGITFDTGGICLKPSQYQINMKYDMSGAAIVCLVMKMIAQLELKVNVVAVACVTENAIGSKAILTESVVIAKANKSVEIVDTDAEGRLVLADGISYALQELSATHILTVATLTGSIRVALGGSSNGACYTGAFTTCDQWWTLIAQAAQDAHELIWRMPINDNFTKILKKSAVADLTNVAKSATADHIIAAGFLKEFCDNKPLLHLDIAGTDTTHDHLPTGVMFKTLMHYFINLSYQQQKHLIKTNIN